VANPDSEGKPSDEERGRKIGGTTHDLILFLLAIGTMLSAIGFVASAVERAFNPFTIVYAVLAVLFVYLLCRFSRNWRRPIGQDFNI